MSDNRSLADLTKNTKLEFPLSQFPTRHYYGRGKLMLSGEYVSLYGAKVLAIPTVLGQTMLVRTRPSNNPVLNWKGIDCQGQVWFAAKFELWHFETEAFENGEIDHEKPVVDPDKIYYLQKLLRAARNLNPHFLRDEEDVFVETRLEFSLDWGLGSSSSLIYNVAQWAYISPFKLAQSVSSGSHYDIACAQSTHPIHYQLDIKAEEPTPTWQSVNFAPPFAAQLFFIYRGNKKDTESELKRFKKLGNSSEELKTAAKEVSLISKYMTEVTKLEDFSRLMDQHEEIISSLIDIKPIKESSYKDFPGSIKSLGAWGGDFAMVASKLSEAEIRAYFSQDPKVKVLTYNELFVDKSNVLHH